MKMYQHYVNFLSNLGDIPLLALRLLLAYAFFGPAIMKWGDMEATIAWFGNPDWGLGLPFPALNAYMSASIEMLGVILLVLGLGTRVISLPLIFVLFIAYVTVHSGHGWLAIGSSANDPEIAERLNAAKGILKENGDYSWLTAKGSFVILQNGAEFVVTYAVMLLSLMAFGPGKLSLDHLISSKKKE
jgi:putative oxidoreductase